MPPTLNRPLKSPARLALLVFGIAFVALFVGFAIAEGLGEPSVPAGDVALVQSVPSDFGHVSEAEFKRALLQQVAQGQLKKTPKPGSKKYEELQTTTMTELLQSVWIRGEAEELGIAVTDKQIKTELASIKKQNFPTPKAYKEFLKTSHYTQADVDEKVELQLLSTKIQEQITNQTPPASDAEIAAYYDENKDEQFTTKPSRNVRVVLTEDKGKAEAAKAILAKDNSPASWKKVAAKYSTDPTSKSKGGLLEDISEETLQEPLKAAVFENAVGKVIGPIKYQSNSIVLQVDKLNPASVKPLKEVKSQISTQLTQQKQQEFFTEFIGAFQSKWTARTYCAADFLVEQCVNYKGSSHAKGAPEACYEADPKTPTTECPAPVEQVKPALPGTVTPLEPKGKPLAQRPQPEGLKGSTEGEAPSAAPGAVPPTSAAPSE